VQLYPILNFRKYTIYYYYYSYKDSITVIVLQSAYLTGGDDQLFYYSMNSQLLHINKANCTVSPMSNNNIYVIIELTVKKKLYIKIIIQVLIATFDVQ
jgi:hypothetical protein